VQRYDAVLVHKDGSRIRVRVPDPPPAAFTFASFPGPNRMFFREGSETGPVKYVEDRRRHQRYKVTGGAADVSRP
jgi:hypothetical protein